MRNVCVRYCPTCRCCGFICNESSAFGGPIFTFPNGESQEKGGGGSESEREREIKSWKKAMHNYALRLSGTSRVVLCR